MMAEALVAAVKKVTIAAGDIATFCHLQNDFELLRVPTA
jgi:hypothetical protein